MIFYPSIKHVINVVPWAKIEIEIFVEHHTTLLEHDGKEAKSCSEVNPNLPTSTQFTFILGRLARESGLKRFVVSLRFK